MMRRIERGQAEYPTALNDCLGDAAPPCLYTLGNTATLGKRLLGFPCSIQCPGSIVIKTFDAIREIRDAGVAVIGGFHSPMERECLEILLRGKQPVIFCAAKGLPGLRLGSQARRAINEDRLLVISPFAEDVRRTTADQALERNKLIGALSDVFLVPYAAPAGKIWATISSVIDRGQTVLTFESKENSELIAVGAQPFIETEITKLVDKTFVEICRLRGE